MPRLAAAFHEAGAEIVPIEVPPSQLEGELRSGRRFELAYRVLKCREPVLEAGFILCPGYDAPPESDSLASAASTEILRLLLELEHATDWTTARSLAQQIDRESRDELPIIPLWQLGDHYAWRDRLDRPEEGRRRTLLGNRNVGNRPLDRQGLLGNSVRTAMKANAPPSCPTRPDA